MLHMCVHIDTHMFLCTSFWAILCLVLGSKLCNHIFNLYFEKAAAVQNQVKVLSHYSIFYCKWCLTSLTIEVAHPCFKIYQ